MLAAGAGAALAVRNWGTGWVPRCPFRALTGLDCPGCGTTRAVEALLHGDVGAAIGFNAFAMLYALPVLAWWIVTRLLGRADPVVLRSARWASGLAVAVVVFAVARNLPVPGLRTLAA